ncbi:MAG TPA: STAS domain-containing protein [Gaiellaceae bacterium]|nr:STAS domain-containing protein [Gaiellaceae bacterium]
MCDPAPDPGVTVLRLESAADLWRLRARLGEAAADRRPLIVDLSGVAAIDAATAALLVDGVARSEEQERTCLLLVPETCPDTVRERLEPNGLTGLLPIVRSWDEALRRADAAAGG